MNLLLHLVQQKLISPPAWLPANTHYLTIMGSIAYGVADTNDEEVQSDFDLYGFCIPPKEVVFPHTAGAVWGFGRYKEGMPRSHFGQYQKHHVHDPSARGGKGRMYDLQIDLEGVRSRSGLPPGPDEDAIRDILLRCLEAHYGSLDGCIQVPGRAESLLRQIRELIEINGF
jgi:hypothetical protein